MSHCLDLIVPAVPDLPGLQDRAVGWMGGEDASPRPYRWGPDVELRAYPVAESPFPGLHRLPAGFVDAHWKVVAVEAPSLRGTRYPAGEDPLEALLRGLLARCDRWALVFSVECEQPVDSVHPASVDAALVRLRASLAGPHREGFIACGPERGEHDPSLPQARMQGPPMNGGDPFLTTHPSGVWGVRPLLAVLGDQPFVAAVVGVLPRGAESGLSEARGATVERVWDDVLSRVPGVSGVRVSWDMLLFLVPAGREAELDGALEMALRHASTPDVELFCAAAELAGTADEKLKMLDGELMEEFGARRNFGTRPSVRGRRVDGAPWP